MNLTYRISKFLQKIAGVRNDIDTADATARIKSGIWFRGSNVWILAFAIIVASVGLNVNSTAVIIGAMLISPVMGPILGIGLSLGTGDLDLMKLAVKNLLIMVVISLLASCAYFIVSPLDLADPTELQARTSPTIYDVLIAFFGGAAGILENSRKERGTVISGVAIATALMPPLCTAGFGLANLNMRFFFGAMYLFIINTVFIATATYIGTKLLHYPVKQTEGRVNLRQQRTRRIISGIFIVILVPSIISAFGLIRENRFLRNVREFVAENRVIGKTYIYDYTIHKTGGNKVTISLAGEPLKYIHKTMLYESAKMHGLSRDQVILHDAAVGSIGGEEVEDIVQSIYEHTDASMMARDAHIQELRQRVEQLESSLAALREATVSAASDSLTADSSASVLPAVAVPALTVTPSAESSPLPELTFSGKKASKKSGILQQFISFVGMEWFHQGRQNSEKN